MDYQLESSVLLKNTTARRVLVDHLKRCPVCGALNTYECAECFVCTWYGTFDHDPDSVEASLDELILRCPELVDAMMIEAAVAPTFKEKVANWFERTGATVKSWFNRKRPNLDINA